MPLEWKMLEVLSEAKQTLNLILKPLTSNPQPETQTLNNPKALK